MNNIFESAKFGDKFLTRDGMVAAYVSIRREPCYDAAFLIIEGENIVDEFYLNGRIKKGYSGNDIVSRYQEPIDEDKLDELAKSIYNSDTSNNEFLYQIQRSEIQGFKAGYRKANEYEMDRVN